MTAASVVIRRHTKNWKFDGRKDLFYRKCTELLAKLKSSSILLADYKLFKAPALSFMSSKVFL